MINPTNDNAELQLKDIVQAGLMLSRPITIQKASNEREIEEAFKTFAQQQVDALLSGFRSVLLRRTRKNRDTGGTLQFAGNVRVARICTSRRNRELRNQSFGQLSYG